MIAAAGAKAALVAALALFHVEHPRAEVDPTPVGQTIYVSESIASFNADRGDTVIVVMDEPDDAAIERCLDMGGEPILDPHSNVLYCEDVDF